MLSTYVSSIFFFQTNFGKLSSAMSTGSFRIDHEYMPFGRLSTETIEKAREVLREIKWVLRFYAECG